MQFRFVVHWLWLSLVFVFTSATSAFSATECGEFATYEFPLWTVS
jgi:hypothetical protein